MGRPLASDSTADEQRCWASFQDPVLLDLLHQAHTQSPTLQSAAEQGTQAESVLRSAKASSQGAASLVAGSHCGQPDLASKLKGLNEGSTTDQLRGPLSWEPNVWGRQGRALQFNLAQLESSLAAARADLQQQGESLRIAQTQAHLPALRYALATCQHALSVLLGQTPDRFAIEHPPTQALPSTPTHAAVAFVPVFFVIIERWRGPKPHAQHTISKDAT